MQLFHLRPIRTDAPPWWTSRYVGACFISAADERAARAALTRCFAKTVAWSPWDNPELTACTVVRGLDRIPPDPGIVMVPSRTAFGGWRVVPVPESAAERLRRSA
jgi:hypothetical protein